MTTSGGPGAPDAPADLLRRLAARAPDQLRHVHVAPARSARPADWPGWVAPELRAALEAAGTRSLWSHQVEAATAAYAGEHVILATGTGSGKSLGYLLPALTQALDGRSALTGRGATTLYLAPTKALAHDQAARIEALGLAGLRAATLDGDTEPEQRDWVQAHAAYVLTNPDTIHHALLPGHRRWASFLRPLRFVVVDECHAYRGLFGSHVALVLRRLQRVAAHYRAHPTVVLVSGTLGDPEEHARRLVGVPVRPVTDTGAPRPEVTIGMWRAEHGIGPGSSTRAAAEWLGRLVVAGRQTVAFTRSRASAEQLAAQAREVVDASSVLVAPPAGEPTSVDTTTAGEPATVDTTTAGEPATVDTTTAGEPATVDTTTAGEPAARRTPTSAAIAAYRGGFLPEERRALESDLRSGRLVGVAATTALELGVDVTGLDAVVIAGWPGSIGSFWQQVGRAGRGSEPALAVFVAGDDPLDSYVVEHPEAVFGRPVDTVTVDLDNRIVLERQLACAAAEVPIRDSDLAPGGPFGIGAAATAAVDALVGRRTLRRRPDGWFWPHPQRPTDHVDLRGIGASVRVVERRTGRVLGLIDAARADSSAHIGAVYLHQGQPHVVVDADPGAGAVLVVAGDPGWTTRARSQTRCELADPTRVVSQGEHTCAVGEITVHHQVTSFLRIAADGSVLGEHPLDLPERTMSTVGTWWCVGEAALTSVQVPPTRLAGALHAVEHALVGLLPLVASADRPDVGSSSAPTHPDTGFATIVVYDNASGGAGFAERGFLARRRWVSAARAAVTECPCDHGCPCCVQSPFCGRGNTPLDKSGAGAVLQLLEQAD